MRLIYALTVVVILSGCDPHRRTGVAGGSMLPVMPAARAIEVVRTPKEGSPQNDAVRDAGTREISEPERPDADKAVSRFNELFDAFFAYDDSTINEAALQSLRKDADVIASFLAKKPGTRLIVEGHCDERGSAEYNLALGEQRAARALGLLRELGLAAVKIEMVSYGKEQPQCTEQDETCWQRNRRAHLVLARQEERR